MGPVPTVSGEPAKAPRVGWAGGTRDVTHAVRSLSLYLRPPQAPAKPRNEGEPVRRAVPSYARRVKGERRERRDRSESDMNAGRK